jgi:predicted nucleic acid-binding protein
VNKKRSRDNDKLLLDTSFLLPILGFKTSDRIMKAFTKLRNHTIYYSDLSLLEALWKIVKKIKGINEEIERIREGIVAIMNTFNHVMINEDSIEYAVKMYMLGHRDMIDNLLYATALSNNMRLLTVDKELIEFIEKQGLPRSNIIEPEEL